MEPHSRCEGAIPPHSGREAGAQRILDAGAERGYPRPERRVVLPPVAVAAAPHLVDPAFGDRGAELRLVVNDRRAWEVVHLPPRAPEPQLQVDLLGVDEEPFVEEPNLVESIAPVDERRA